MLSYSWGMTSNKRGCEAQTPSLVPPIEASPLLIYSHFGRPNGGVGRPSPNEGPNGGVGRPSPNEGPNGGVGRPSPNEGPNGGVGRPSPNEGPNGGVGRPSPNEGPNGGVGRPSAKSVIAISNVVLDQGAGSVRTSSPATLRKWLDDASAFSTRMRMRIVWGP